MKWPWRSLRRKLRSVEQMEAVECGAACLTMVLWHFGHHIDLASVREATGVSRDGVTAKSIVQTARRFGLVPKARRLEPEQLETVEGPAILHWEMNHFVVFDRWTTAGVRLLDPAVGPRLVSHEEFDRSFSGICIEFTRGESFRERRRARPSLQRYLSMLRSAGGALALLFLASLLLNVFGLAIPIATQFLVDQVLRLRQAGWLEVVGLGLLTCILAQFTVALARGALVARLQAFLDAEVGEGFVRHLLALPMRVLAQRYTADLVARVQATRALRELLTGNGVALLVDGLLLLSYLALALAYEPRLGLVVLGGLVLYGLTYALARPGILARYRERIVRDTKREIELHQTLAGIMTLKAAGREEGAFERWSRKADRADGAAARELARKDTVSLLLFLVRSAVPALVLCLGASMVLNGRLTLGALLGALFLQGAIFTPFEQLIGTLLKLQELPVQLERMDDVLQTEVEATGTLPCPNLQGEIVFEDVCFRYGPTAPLTLDKVSFTVRKGEKIALVGPSASGKSTVARLLLGLFRPESGRILIDGHELSQLDLAAVRKQLGVVLQETAIFPGTVRENIALYRRHAPLSDVVLAARVAQLHDVIEALPQAYETQLSPTSCPLSGGQRQRLALARALLHKPSILVLDEATSALDAVTEAAVGRFLESMACTRLVIAHRLSTVKDADRILVLKNGRVVEEGSPAALAARGGLYATMLATQSSAHSAEERERQEARRRAKERPRLTAEDLAPFAILDPSDTGPSDLAALAALLTQRSVPAGAALVEQGEKSPGLFLVQQGALEVLLAEPGLAPLKVGEAGPGAVVGELSLLEGSAAAATVRAREDTRVLHLSLRAFEQLRATQDPLGARLLVGLGAVIAQRLRALLRERASLGDGDKSEPAASTASHSDYEMSLEETPLGAALTAAQRELFVALGSYARLGAGEVLCAQDAPSDRTWLVLRGRVAISLHGVRGHVDVIKPGDVVGEAAFFDGGAHESGCVALEPVTVFAIQNDALRVLARSGSDVAWKVLRAFVRSTVHDLRIATLRHRELVARKGDEFTSAREQLARIERLAREEDKALAAIEANGRRGRAKHVPLVLEEDVGLHGAACVTAVLRYYNLPVRRLAVFEACSEGGERTERSLIAGAASFGMVVRRVAVSYEDLRYLERPLVLSNGSGGYVVAERWRRGKLCVMDPARGTVWLTAEEVRPLLGDGLELRPEEHQGAQAALRVRLLAQLREHGALLVPLTVATVLLQVGSIATPLVTGFVIGDVLPSGDGALLRAVALTLAAVLAVEALTRWTRDRTLAYLRARIDRSLLGQLFRHVLRLPLTFFEQHPRGELLQRFQGLETLRSLLDTESVGALLDLPATLLAAVCVAMLAPSLALLVGLAALCFVVVFAVTAPRSSALSAAQYATGAEQVERLLAVLNGLTQLRLTGDPEAGLRLWAPAFTRRLRLGALEDRVATNQAAALQLIGFSALGAMLFFGAEQVVRGALPLGSLMAATALGHGLLGALAALLARLTSFARAREALDRVGAAFAETPEQGAEPVTPPGKLRGAITLSNVSFGYGPEAPKILKGISLEIAAGSKVALVGASGAGKSTLGKLLLGFYLPDAGRILFDGRDLRGLDLRRLRNQLGVVLQDSFLFSGSIRENLNLTAPHAPLESLVAAARRAAIHDDIEAMPMKYETIVTDGGGAFSGGQRQRLALARALVNEPPILLLDEATSALDNLSQHAVEEQLAALSCTRIVIAHRLSTVLDADQIVVLDKGELVEVGRHEELLARRGHYFRLVESQL